jgi:hypothetical protein
MVWLPSCTGDNEAHDILEKKLNSEDVEERSRRGYSKDPLAHGKVSRVSTELPDKQLGPEVGILARGDLGGTRGYQRWA